LFGGLSLPKPPLGDGNGYIVAFSNVCCYDESLPVVFLIQLKLVGVCKLVDVKLWASDQL